MTGDGAAPDFRYVAVDPAAAPCVTLVCPGGDPAALATTAESLGLQSLQRWEWLPGAPPTAARAPHVVALEAGDRLAPTALETWLWALASHGAAPPLPTDRGPRALVGPPARPNGVPADDGPDKAGRVQVSDELPFTNPLTKTRPRLLMLVPWLSFGGAEKFTLDLLRELRRRGWEVTVAVTLDAEHHWASRFTDETPDVFLLPRFLRLNDYPRFVRYLVESRAVDAVLIAHSEVGYLLLPYLRAHHPHLAVLDFCHVVDAAWKGGGYPRLALAYGPLLDTTVVASAHLRDWMLARDADPSRLAVCHTNIDTECWHPDPARRQATRRDLGLDPDVPVILHAARLCAQKQPGVVTATLARLAAQGLPFTAVIAGDGPDRAAVERDIRRDGLAARVHLLGAVPNERMRDLLAAADIFFLPSSFEGISLALFEAMACGVCVVTADVGGQSELVTPDCGVLMPPATPATDTERYTAALAGLLGDPARRTRLGAAARARVVGAFRLEHMGTRMEELIRQAIRRARERPAANGRALAPALAEQAVAAMWTAAHAHSVDPYRTDWRTLAYFALRRALLPWYERAHAHAGSWPATVKDTLRHWLVRP